MSLHHWLSKLRVPVRLNFQSIRRAAELYLAFSIVLQAVMIKDETTIKYSSVLSY